jgi:hypothetical protein
LRKAPTPDDKAIAEPRAEKVAVASWAQDLADREILREPPPCSMGLMHRLEVSTRNIRVE